jgi:hypothetical protein
MTGQILITGKGGTPLYAQAYLHEDMTGLYECSGCCSAQIKVQDDENSWRVPLKRKAPCRIADLGDVEVRLAGGTTTSSIVVMTLGARTDDITTLIKAQSAICGHISVKDKPVLLDFMQEQPDYVRVKGRIVDVGAAEHRWIQDLSRDGSDESMAFATWYPQFFYEPKTKRSVPMLLASYAVQKKSPNIPIYFEEVTLTIDHVLQIGKSLSSRQTLHNIEAAIARKKLHEEIMDRMKKLGSTSINLDMDAMDVIEVILVHHDAGEFVGFKTDNDPSFPTLVENLTKMQLRFQEGHAESFFLDYAKALSVQEILKYDNAPVACNWD